MGRIPGVSVADYLHEIYRPDCDYVDGEVQERNMGEKEHSAWQGALTEYFRKYRKAWQLQVYPELRLQVLPTRFRVLDIMLLRQDAPDEQIITHPAVALRRDTVARGPLRPHGRAYRRLLEDGCA